MCKVNGKPLLPALMQNILILKKSLKLGFHVIFLINPPLQLAHLTNRPLSRILFSNTVQGLCEMQAESGRFCKVLAVETSLTK